MRTGARGIFPAYYAHEVIGQTKDLMGKNQDESGIVKCIKTSVVCYVIFTLSAAT